MIKCLCIGCSAVVEANDDASGTAVICAQCGYVVQVPDAARAVRIGQGSASAQPKATPPQTAERRVHYVLGGLYGLFVVCLPLALIHAQDGSPLCLLLFSVNLLLATIAGFLFFAGMHTPDYLTDWLHMPFTRLRAALLLLPLTVLGFAVAIHIYSP